MVPTDILEDEHKLIERAMQVVRTAAESLKLSEDKHSLSA